MRYVTAARHGAASSAQSYLGFNTIILMQPAHCWGWEAAGGAGQSRAGEWDGLGGSRSQPETPFVSWHWEMAVDGWEGRCHHCTGGGCGYRD